jgi:hypothetical protein
MNYRPSAVERYESSDCRNSGIANSIDQIEFHNAPFAGKDPQEQYQ